LSNNYRREESRIQKIKVGVSKASAKSICVFTQSTNVLTQLTQVVQGKWCGVSTNFGGLWMQNSRKMKFEMFIHNDDVTCFHVALWGTQKVVVMGCHNFKDETLIKGWQVGQKMNAMGRKFKDEK
jgi:hypothetical protein